MEPPQKRTRYEVIVDRLLLIYLVVLNRRRGNNIHGASFERQVKLQKLLYWCEHDMFQNKYKGLNYNFFKWTHGPFAQEIYIDSRHLINNGFIEENSEELRVSEKGLNLIEELTEVFTLNKDIISYMDRIVRRFGEYDADKIMNATYAFPVPGAKIPISRIRKGDLILPKLSIEQAEQSFYINDDWMETLKILFDPYLYSAINTSISEMKSDRGRPFKPEIRLHGP